jgi:hypothetical protein
VSDAIGRTGFLEAWKVASEASKKAVGMDVIAEQAAQMSRLQNEIVRSYTGLTASPQIKKLTELQRQVMKGVHHAPSAGDY